MKKLISFLFLCILALRVSAQAPLTVKDVTNYKYYPRTIGLNPSPVDAEHYLVPSQDGRQLLSYSFRTGSADGVVVDIDQAKGDVKPQSVQGYIFSPDGAYMLFPTNRKQIYRHSFTADYLLYDVKNRRFTPLSDGGPQQAPQFSPDGTVIAFARGGNLFLVKLLFGAAESQVTKDGEYNAVLNGIPDWVNEEEFSTASSFTFTADSKTLVWVRYDETRVPLYNITEYKGAAPALTQNDEYPGAFTYKYPVAGVENSIVSVKAFDIKERTTRTLDLPLGADGYVPRILTSPRTDEVLVVTLPRLQNEMNVYACNVRSRECKQIVHEESKEYIKETAYTSMRTVGDALAYISDRDGHAHIYLYSLSGTLLRQVTKGDYEVTQFYGCNNTTRPAEATYFFQATEGGPLRRAVCSVDKSGKFRNLTPEKGTNAAVFSTGAMKYFQNTYSSATQPYVYTLRDAATGKVLSTQEDNAAFTEAWKQVVAPGEFFTFTTSEGVQLNGYMVRPRSFDASKKYPVILYQYSGPGSQEVHDSWNIGFMPGSMYESLLAQEGFISVIVDGRGTGFRGADFEKCTYQHLGLYEARDQVETALYLATLPYVDAQRIGIWGWSFGGFNTLMAMSEGRPVFRAGVAVAAPSNWKYYDTVYTERYMRTPQQNAAGYAVNPIERAEKLHGSLLLVHGTADDNVHFRNFAEVSEAYVQAGKQFQQQVYTNRNHFINGGRTREHLFTRMLDFFKSEMK